MTSEEAYKHANSLSEVRLELRKRGGTWLSEARAWMQWNRLNGSDVTWGSDQALRPTMTVADVEDLAAHVAAAVMIEHGITFKAVPK